MSYKWKYLSICFFVGVFISAVAVSRYLRSIQASGIAFQTGDVVAAVGRGTIKHFSPTGTLLDTLSTGGRETYDAGMAFDIGKSLYITAFDGQTVYKFDSNGNPNGSFGSGYNLDPESVVLDKNGNAYVGEADGSALVLKFSPTGALLASYAPQREQRGTDWVDLAADQCTLHYTSEGSMIKQFNACTNAQLPDFATGLSGPCYAHRIRPNFEELVACTSLVYRLNSSGGVIQTYQLPGTSLLFALNLDPDNKSFWTGDLINGAVFRVDIATGATITQFSTGVLSALGGLAIVGEITAAVTVPPSTTSYYIQTSKSSTLRGMGSNLAQSQLAAGTNQDSVAVLLFRAPAFVGGQYGNAISGSFIPLSTVATLAEDFASGYYNSLGSNQTLHLRIVIATSNSPNRVALGGDQVTFGHGQAWAQMVNNVASWVIAQGYSGQVDIAGGSDMEPDFDSPVATRTWVAGYGSVSPNRFLYDVGSATGCPTNATAATPAPCGTQAQPTWTQEDVWYVSWGADPSEPLPEIYGNANAKQWANLSLYGFLAHGGSVIMSGAFTEYQACLQNPTDPTCNPVNTPAQGWQQLHDRLNLDSRTAQTLSWSTDVKWSSH